MSRRKKQEPGIKGMSDAFHQAFDDLKNDYAAGKSSRLRPRPSGISGDGSGADYHYRSQSQFLMMLERSRFFDRDNMVVRQGVDRLTANVVGDEGFTLDIRTGTSKRDKQLDKELMDRWNEWANDEDACDYEGEKCFSEFESLAFRSTIVDGDVFCLPLREHGSLQAVEAHRVRTPTNTSKNVVHGVEMFDSGRRKAYWVTKEDLDPNRALTRVSDVEQIDARDEFGRRQVFHVYSPRRFSQRRGVTAFTPIVDVCGMHDDIQFSHLVKAQVASCFAIFEEFDIAASGNKPGATVTGSQTSETVADGTVRTIEGLAPGMRIRGNPGSTLKGFSPNIPNPEFFPHATLLLTFIAINLDLPVAVLLLDPSNTNFSGWRGAIDQARQRFRFMQKHLRKKFHTPVYKFKLMQWLSENPRLESRFRSIGPRIFNHRWNPPTWSYIEPLKDASADDLRQSRNLISQRRRAAERGYDFDEMSTEIVEDRGVIVTKAIALAQQINNENPDANVDWRELAYGHQTSGVKYTFGDVGDSESEQAEEMANAS